MRFRTPERRLPHSITPHLHLKSPSHKSPDQIRKFMSDDIHANGSKKLKTKMYQKELRKLQSELCKLQAWIKHKGLRAIVVFEGRDGAGKGGTIRAISERVSPRSFCVLAWPGPSDPE